jgi:aryl-alcohol dehydrogenase-like predicted oxidoreductase
MNYFEDGQMNTVFGRQRKYSGMEYTKLGSTGVDVSEICLGTWRFGMESEGVLETDRETAHALLDRFAEAGGNFIDTANAYGDGDSERWIGEWLTDRDREDYVIASKVYWAEESRFDQNLSRKNIRAEIEGTLDRLNTDYLDLYYIHRWDDDTPIEETLRTLTRLVEEGKVHYLGASTMAAWKLTKALWTADVEGLESFTVTQPQHNAVYRDEVAEYLDVCADQDLAVCPYSPLEAGFLTGKYERDGDIPEGSRGDIGTWFDPESYTDRQWATLEAMQEVAAEADATPAQVAIRWLIERDRFTCVPIIGARTVDQLEENLGAADLSLSDGQTERITEAYQA